MPVQHTISRLPFAVCRLILPLICALAINGTILAQDQPQGKVLYHYVFPAFTEGTVKKKSGEINRALLNYNSLTEEMIFDQGGKHLALDKIEEIDTVFVNGKAFVPVGNVFYEVATTTPVALLVQYKTGILPPGGNTGFGTSQTSAISNVYDLKRAGTAYTLKLPDEYVLTSKTIYWLKQKDKFTAIKNLKDVQDMFPGKSAEIREFAKSNKINFKDPDDVKKLILFCN